MLLALLLAACSHDVVVDPGNPTLTATQLTLTPATATVDTAGTLQLQSALTWNDGKVHTADIAMTTNGGSIAANGIYHASGAPGTYLIVATCTCGVADTSTVTVLAQTAPPAANGQLVVTVTGLPLSAAGQMTLTGPSGYSRVLTATATLDSLVPGAYTLAAASIAVGAESYTAAPTSQAVTIAGGDHQGIAVTYTHVIVNTGLPPHPRVWMTPDRLLKLKAQVAANTSRWQVVKRDADAQVARGTSYASADEDYLPHLCAAYLGTGDVRYAQRAGTVLTAYAVEANDLHGDSGYDFRSLLPIVTTALDWCYDGLTVGQRHQVATWLMNRADWVWPETNGSRLNAWGTNAPSNNYYWGFMSTGPAALAAAGDDTLTGPISGSNRPAYHQALVLHRWFGEASAYLAGDGAGGGWAEGTGYDSSWRLGRFMDAFLTSGQPIPNDFAAASLQYRFHTSAPGYLYKVPFGDQARVSTADLFTYDRYGALVVLPVAGASPTVASQVYSWLNRIGQVSGQEYGAAEVEVEELTRFDPSVAAAADLSSVPKSFLASGLGQFIYHSSWTDPNATMWTFESGPLTEYHGSLNANGLMIWKGSFWISANANIYSHSGIEQITRDNNNLTVGGLGQLHALYNTGVPNFGKILGTQVSDQLVVVRGQASHAYSQVLSFPITDYVRTVSYLPASDVFVIVDRATITDGSQTKTWRWHMKGLPVIAGNTFRLDNPNGDAHCYGTVLSPSVITLGTEDFAFDSDPVTSHAVTVSMSGSATDVVVTVLQCSTSLAIPAVPVALFTGTQATVTVGSSILTVPFDTTLPVHQ